MSGKTERKAGLIYSIVVTFIMIVLVAVMVLEYATPFKPSNGFKRAPADQEQTEQLPDDKPNDEGKDKDKDEKPDDGKEDPEQKDPEQEDPTANPEQSAQSYALLVTGVENFDFEVLPISEWSNEDIGTTGAQSFYRVSLLRGSDHELNLSIRSKDGAELFRTDGYGVESGTWEFDDYVVYKLSDSFCDIIILKPFDFSIWVVDIYYYSSSSVFENYDRMEIKCAYYADTTATN